MEIKMSDDTVWHTVAFAPAPVGWYAQFVDGPDRWSVPIAGWLTQSQFIESHLEPIGEWPARQTWVSTQRMDAVVPQRIVAATVLASGEIVPLGEHMASLGGCYGVVTLGGVYGPGQTPDDANV